jgi:hypothetical protein
MKAVIALVTIESPFPQQQVVIRHHGNGDLAMNGNTESRMLNQGTCHFIRGCSINWPPLPRRARDKVGLHSHVPAADFGAWNFGEVSISNPVAAFDLFRPEG